MGLEWWVDWGSCCSYTCVRCGCSWTLHNPSHFGWPWYWLFACSYCLILQLLVWFVFLGGVVWFISDLKAWIIILITHRCLFYYCDSFHFGKPESVLCSQMCIIYSHCIFSEAFADKKVLWIHFKGKWTSIRWSLISRLGFNVQIGAAFLTVSYFLCQVSGSIPFSPVTPANPQPAAHLTSSNKCLCWAPACFLSSTCAYPSEQIL